MIIDQGVERDPEGSGSREPGPASRPGPTGFDPSRSRCETCQHWFFDRADWQFDELQIGECKAIRQRETIEEDALLGTGIDSWDDEAAPLIKAAMIKAKAIAVDGSGYYAALRTFSDFGCVLHSPRDSGIEARQGGDGEAGSIGDESPGAATSGNRPDDTSPSGIKGA